MQNTKLATKLAVASARHRTSTAVDAVRTRIHPERDLTIEAAHEVALVWNDLYDLDVVVETKLSEMDREFGDMLRTPQNA